VYNVVVAVIIFGVLSLLTSCKKHEKQANFYFDKGVLAAKKKNYQSCIFNLNKIDEMAPYSQESKSAAPILIFCHYAMKDFEAMHSEINNFESLYPTSSELPYLYYIKTLSYYKTFKDHKKSLQIVESLESGIDKINEIDTTGSYSRNINMLIPFIEDVKEKNSLYIANNYAISQNFISAAARYSQAYNNSNEDNKKIVENSMDAVLRNLGIKK